MRGLLLYIAILLCLSGSLFAQDPHFTQINRIPSFNNPAAAGNGVEHIRLTMLYRNQWASVTTPFVTQGFFFDKQVGKVGLGANLVNNSAGEAGIRQLLLNGILNYRFDFDKNHFTAGMQVGLIQKSFDPSKMTFDDQYLPDQGYDPSNATAETFSYTKVTRPDLGLGMFWTHGTPGKDKVLPYAGFSAQHILQPKETFILDQNSVPIKLNAQAGLGIHINDDLQITPSILYVKQQNSSELVAGAVVRLPLQERNMVEGGIYYRKGDAMALYGGYQWNNFLLGASYDVNISGLTKGPGAFELTLTYIPKAKIKKQPEKNPSKPVAVKKPAPTKKPATVSKPTEVKKVEAKAPSKVSSSENSKPIVKTEAPAKPKSNASTVKITATAQPKKPMPAVDTAKTITPTESPKVVQLQIKGTAPIVTSAPKVDSIATPLATPRNATPIKEIKLKPVVINKNSIKKPTSEIVEPTQLSPVGTTPLPVGDFDEIEMLNTKPIAIDKSSMKKPTVKINPNINSDKVSPSTSPIERENIEVKEMKSKPITLDKSSIKKPVVKIATPISSTKVENYAPLRDESEVKLLKVKSIIIDRKSIKKPISTIIVPVFDKTELVRGNDFRKDAAIKLMKPKAIGLNKKSIKKPVVELQIPVDSDKDGVEDRLDQCPDKKGTISTLGCPLKENINSKEQIEKVTVESTEAIIEEVPFEVELNELNSSYMGAIEFEKGKSQSHGVYKIDVIEPALDSAWFNKDFNIVLTGHTYQESDAKTSIELSKARVEAVKAIFVKKGIDASRIITVPYGDRKPATNGNSVYDIAKNRRVEVYILKPTK
jgi:type IX secretion system PorP/SprF family membrane protein